MKLARDAWRHRAARKNDNHPDSDLAEVGGLSAIQALGQIEGSILRISRIFKAVCGGFPSLNEQMSGPKQVFTLNV